jgi:hypothetical protein
MRVVAISFVVCACWFAAACGSTDQTQSHPVAAQLTTDDLQTLVTVSPNATGWSWTVDPQTRFMSPSVELKLDKSEPSYEIQKAVTDAYSDAGFVRSATSDWWDNEGGKKASSFATLFATSDGATKALAADREFARHWFQDFEHQQIREINADGIGAKSWAVQAGDSQRGFVEIGWSHGNATLSVYVSCYPCHSDVADAARRWAKAIDDSATAAED